MENDLVAVIVLGGRWSCVCSRMSDGLVEKWCNLIAFVATGNQSSQKTFVHVILLCSQEQRVKLWNSVLYTIRGRIPGGWAEWGGMNKCKFSAFLKSMMVKLW